MTDRPKVGFAGVGLMGRGMAGNILAKGYPLTVLGHQNRAPVEALKADGAGEAASPRELAETSDIIFLCMPNSRVVERVCLGDDGIVHGAKPGTLVLDTSTAEPASTKRVAAALAEKGIDFIDAPMTMTPKEAMEGTLNVLVGGPDALVEKARPVLECYARNIFHIGPLGAAHALKLINNFMSMSMSALIAEAATTARASGVDLGKLREVVSAGAVNSGMFQKIMAYAVDGDASGLQFAMANARKDVGYYNDIAAEAGLPAPFGSAALQLYTLACATGHGGEYVPLLVDVMAELGGLNGAGK